MRFGLALMTVLGVVVPNFAFSANLNSKQLILRYDSAVIEPGQASVLIGGLFYIQLNDNSVSIYSGAGTCEIRSESAVEALAVYSAVEASDRIVCFSQKKRNPNHIIIAGKYLLERGEVSGRIVNLLGIENENLIIYKDGVHTGLKNKEK